MNIKRKLAPFTQALKLCELLMKAGGEARFIGGCVRDMISARKINDIDIATNLLPEVIENILSQNKVAYFSIGKEFGTITAVIEDKQYEITTLRKDLACDGRYAKVSFSNNWSEDAQRRDFTINALSCDLEGNIYDYFEGLKDLENKIVRFIGVAEDRIQEDYLRILRFFRFSAYFAEEVNNDGLIASKKQVAGLKNISRTRIRYELGRIFVAPKAIEILRVMESNGILKTIIPCDESSVNLLEILHQIMIEFDCTTNDLLNFAVLFRHLNKENYIDFNFTKHEKSLLKKLINSNIDDWSISNLKVYWQIYKQDFKKVVLVNLVNYKVSEEIKKELNRLFNIPIKTLPVKGEDLKNLNIEPGKKMGTLLILAERIWYMREFKISKKEIIEELLPHIN